jgi:hypothetical protein
MAASPALEPPRPGEVTIEFAGAPGMRGLIRALVRRRFEAAAVLRCGSERRILARAQLAPPDRESLAAWRPAAERAASHLLAQARRGLELGDLPAGAPLPADPPAVDLRALAGYAWRRCRDSARGRWFALDPARGRLAESNWFLAYRTDPSRFVSAGGPLALDDLRLLLPPEGHAWADPCVFTRDGVEHLFFEDWSLERGRGAIGWMSYDGTRFGAPETVLAEGHHLSYPFVFEAEGQVLMIPESAADGTVSLYEAHDFPRRWRRACVLLDAEPASDATVHRADDGRWWMFVAMGPNSRHHELHAYWAERIRGPWFPHARNPLKLDARSARPAGRLFLRGGRWMRPAQDCGPRYGSAIVLNELVRLTPEDFEERVVERLAPPWPGENLGMHTLAHGRGLEVVDGRVRGVPRRRFPFAEEG